MIMKRLFLFISLFAALAVTGQERIEPVPFGDMEQWVVRYIKESRIIGGKTRVLYAIAPKDTIRKNVKHPAPLVPNVAVKAGVAVRTTRWTA